jgi:hypothetical protein
MLPAALLAVLHGERQAASRDRPKHRLSPSVAFAPAIGYPMPTHMFMAARRPSINFPSRSGKLFVRAICFIAVGSS